MKILFLTYDLPYPLISGGKVRAFHLLKNLSLNHQITLFSYYREESQQQYLKNLQRFCSQIKLFKRGKPWRIQNLLRSLFSSLPFASATYFSLEVKNALEQELSVGKYGLVHFESYYPALWLPLVKKYRLPVVMGNENLEYLIYQRFSQQKPFYLRWLLNLEVRKMKRFEEKLWQQADINLAISKKDATEIEKVTGKPCAIVPNGVEVNTLATKRPLANRQKLIFIGTLIYQANSEAMKYFLQSIYPLIKKKNPQVKLLLVSWYQPDWLKRYLGDKTIEFVQDKNTPSSLIFQKADILVAPMRVASGTRIKILEAMASGLPVVTTSIGIEGIEATHNKEVIVADQAEEFAQQVCQLLVNSSRRSGLAGAAQKMVKEKYDWVKICQKLNQLYQKFDEKN